ncbi:MAG: GHKL domain-containing protein [Desulfomonile tiedjei]|nr:GHKL domain-containing protein [Desulfomonile tiedjei]
MTEEELRIIRDLTERISSLLKGEVPETLPLSAPVHADVDLLRQATNNLIKTFSEAHGFISALAHGDLDVDPPGRNFLFSPYKQLHANLRHLVWQTQQVAKGDLSQQVDFLGGFAQAFNSMILSLREKRLLEEALKRSHEALEIKVQERTAELTATNEKLRQEITERKKAERDAESALADLIRINNELRQFAYVSSHDLKEPLRNVAISVQKLQKLLKVETGSDEERWITWAVESASRMASLIDDILAFSRLDSGRPFHLVKSEKACQQAISNLRSIIEESGATVTHDGLPRVRADMEQLTQVFQNIIGNAIKYRRDEPPRIHVSAQIKDEECLFCARDNGIGIRQEYVDRIFLIFKQLHQKDEYPGTGIGLAIAKKVVEGYGGRMWVESEYGKGSQFYFTIPTQ